MFYIVCSLIFIPVLNFQARSGLFNLLEVYREQGASHLAISASDRSHLHTSLVVRKPVLGVSDQVPHKPGCTATEDG